MRMIKCTDLRSMLIVCAAPSCGRLRRSFIFNNLKVTKNSLPQFTAPTGMHGSLHSPNCTIPYNIFYTLNGIHPLFHPHSGSGADSTV